MVAGSLFLIVFGTGLLALESLPPLWFDEGWTVCVARTWVEMGHYGCLLNGHAAPPVLSGHFPVVASVAVSFQLFGVGIWQARLVGLLYTFGALYLLYFLAGRIYNRPVAFAALAIAILFPTKWQIHPLIIGRQVLGEMPMMFFLMAGYVCFLRMEQRRIWLAAAIACWAVALMTKGQAAPFWAASMVVPLVIACRKRDWGMTRWLGVALIGSWVLYRLLFWTKDFLLAGHTIAHPVLPGLTEAIALILIPSIRLETFLLALTRWPEYVVAMGYAGWTLWTRNRGEHASGITTTVRVMLLVLSSTWLGWYMLLSAGEPRYALPALLCATPLTAEMFYRFSRGFDSRFLWMAIASLGRAMRFNKDQTKAVIAVGLLAVMIAVVVQERYAFRSRDVDRDVVTVADYFNARTPPEALIETYDSELFLFLNRPYHYPPPQVVVEVIRHHQYPAIPVTYDPLEADPDYIVVGDFGRWGGFYNPLVEQNRMRLVKTIGRYQIYEPVSRTDRRS